MCIHLFLLSNLHFIPEVTILHLTTFMIVSIHLDPAYISGLFLFYIAPLRSSFALTPFFLLFKKVLSLWIFSENVLTDELWFQQCFPVWLSSGVSFSLWACSLKLVLWSSWTQFSTLNIVIPMHLLFSVFLLLLKIFLDVWRISIPFLVLEEKCHINLWDCRFLFLVF